MPTFFILIFLLLTTAPHQSTCKHRRILHQPFVPLDTIPPTKPPISSPQPPTQPKFPFSSSSTPNNQPFFPSFPSPPPPRPSASSATFPANISSLIVPHTSNRKSISPKLLVLAVVLALCSVAFIFTVVLLIYYRRRRDNKTSRSDSHRLYPSNTALSDGGDSSKVRSGRRSGGASTTSSAEFLYLGTLVNSRGIDANSVDAAANNASSSPYQKLGSPELHPLPPLSRHNNNNNFRQNHRNEESSSGEEEEEFYSPRGSSNGSGSRRVFTTTTTTEKNIDDNRRSSTSSDNNNSSYPSSNSASPRLVFNTSPSPSASLSNRSSKCSDSVVVINKLAPPSPPKRKPPSPSPPKHSPPRLSNASSHQSQQHSFKRTSSVSNPPPAPPPPPQYRFWETPPPPPPAQVQEPTAMSRPPVLITPIKPIAFHNPAAVSPAEFIQNPGVISERNEETPKPKLKPLHWDKVRASSDRAMVWDQLKSSSFQLNEEMIETLFVVNAKNLTPKDTWRPVLPSPNQENRVLDPKKSQNIAILLRALNVTVEEVCEALLEGNADTLGTELLESLLKMAPSKEEERKLIEYKDDSPFKLGPAERFLKAVLDIPFAFKKVDAMLYIANFDSEVDYLNKSFQTLEAACEELRNSRMFMKLLEAVLKTGNRMNVGTNRGDAHAFKLDTLLKLVDVKGTDGKTTLLHFVVQEIIRAEGSRLSIANQSPTRNQQINFQNEVEFRKLGLKVVSSLSGELSNVKKAAAMDSDVLSSEVSTLARGIGNIGEVVRLNESTSSKESSGRFSSAMNNFLKKAEEDIIRIQAQESVSLSLVKEITEYFHGNSAKEEAHPFRIFTVVRDFLSTLDQVCKEVGKINDRTIVSSARQFPVPVNPTQIPVFPVRRQYSSSDDESSSTSS